VKRWSLKTHFNKLAFLEVFGDVNDPGAYVRFKSNNLRNVTVYTGGTSPTRNPATPCRADFCCDVDNILKQFMDRALLQKFFNHYILGIEELNREQQSHLENEIGFELRRRNIVPVNKYFRVMRKK
jgi:hypothetical protein